MNKGHVTEEELQEYACNPGRCNAATASHIQQCPACKIAADNYRMLYNATAALPDAVFGFDAEQLVLSKVERTYTGWGLAGLIAIVVLITGYVFKSYFAYLVAHVSGLPLYLVLLATATVIAQQLHTTIKNFRQSCNQIANRLSA